MTDLNRIHEDYPWTKYVDQNQLAKAVEAGRLDEPETPRPFEGAESAPTADDEKNQEDTG